MSLISFPIGDWSKDGHNQCDWYYAETDLDVVAVRKAHRDFKKKYKLEIGEICHDYEDRILSEDQITVLEQLVKLDDYFDYNEDHWECWESDALFELWIKLLNIVNPKLNLIQKADDAVSIIDYGPNHIQCPGYGLF